MKWFFKLLGALIAIIVLLAVIVAVRTAMFKPQARADVPPVALSTYDAQSSAARLSEAIRFRTVTQQDSADTDWPVFLEFQEWLRGEFPDFHRVVTTEMIETYTPMHTWTGRNPDLPLLVILAHQDVVPALETDPEWEHPPFDGVVDAGFIYGRGTMDDKGSLMAIHEAADKLARDGWTPERTLIFVFGADEEVTGHGAKRAAEILRERGIAPAAVLDEGGAIVTGYGGIEKPVAMIGIAEKGYFTVRLTASAEGGHSSRPPDYTAIGALSRAIAAIEANPFEQKLDGVTEQTLKALAPEQDFKTRMSIANLWLFRPMVEGVMKKDPTTRTLMGTSIAPTIIEGGFKENALPREATALVNFRIHPRDTRETVLAHLARVIDDPNIEIDASGGFNSGPSPVSPIEDGLFTEITALMRGVEPDLIVAPYMLAGGTDSRHFAIVTDRIYRFYPIEFPIAQMSAIHGLNEKVEIESYLRGIALYEELFRRTAG
jgi:carboxypeptidase PM20D1